MLSLVRMPVVVVSFWTRLVLRVSVLVSAGLMVVTYGLSRYVKTSLI